MTTQVDSIMLAILPLAGMAASTAIAQTSSQPPIPANSLPSIEAEAASRARQLQLPDSHKSKIEPVIADRRQRIEALYADRSSRPRNNVRSMRKIMSDSDMKRSCRLSLYVFRS